MLKLFHLEECVCVGTAHCHIPVKVIVTLPCLSQVSDSLCIANRENIVQQNLTFFNCKPLLFLGRIEPWY